MHNMSLCFILSAEGGERARGGRGGGERQTLLLFCQFIYQSMMQPITTVRKLRRNGI
jgi:hypothetical protein